MRCPDFRSRHLAWLDAALAPRVGEAMRRHADHCPRCRRYDAALRVGLLLARHHAPLAPTRRFRRILAARLSAEGVPAATVRTGAAILRPYAVRHAQGAQVRA
jgi:hypothetical protein